MCCISKIFKYIYKRKIQGLPCWLSSEESFCQCRRLGFNSWVRKIPWRRIWQPTPVFLPGESHGQRRLSGYSPWGHKESDMTQQLNKNIKKMYDIRLCLLVFISEVLKDTWPFPKSSSHKHPYCLCPVVLG